MRMVKQTGLRLRASEARAPSTAAVRRVRSSFPAVIAVLVASGCGSDRKATKHVETRATSTARRAPSSHATRPHARAPSQTPHGPKNTKQRGARPTSVNPAPTAPPSVPPSRRARQRDLSTAASPQSPCRVEYLLVGRKLTVVPVTTQGGRLVVSVRAHQATQRRVIRVRAGAEPILQFRVTPPVLAITAAIHTTAPSTRTCAVKNPNLN